MEDITLFVLQDGTFFTIQKDFCPVSYPDNKEMPCNPYKNAVC